MQNVITLRSLRWSAEELTFERLASDCVNHFGFAPGTDWTYDEAGKEHHCTFQNGRRTLTVRVSSQQLLTESGSSNLSEDMKRKLRADLCLDSGSMPSGSF